MATDTADVLVVDQTANLPTFCALAYRDESPSVISWIDFWAVAPRSSAQADYRRGQRYAEEAIRHVRATGQSVFIECVLMSIGIKLREEDRRAGELEQGFMDRIAGHYPDAMDKVLMRLLRRHPGTLN